ncbi:MAG: ATP-binding protein [Fibrobacteria bacterium]|nr:ATP-binding protein [Fibrobacteria bacterium]
MSDTVKKLLLLVKDETCKAVVTDCARQLDIQIEYTSPDRGLPGDLEKQGFIAFFFDPELFEEDTITYINNIRRNISRIPVIPILSNKNQAPALIQAGAWNCFIRPLDPDDLLYQLAKLIAERSDVYNPFSVRYEERKIVIPNDFSLVVQVVKNLVYNSLPVEENSKYQVILGLNEIINNAIEHGNLGISYEEKRNALKHAAFFKLAWERANREPFKSRVVTIKTKVFPSICKVEYVVMDEGNGFNWKKLPDPKNKINVLNRNGRGIMIAKYIFDEVHFNEKGNKATLIYYTHKKK